MIYTIENEFIKVDVNDIGAELYSIRTKKDGCEYIWQGDPTYWGSRAINLFPICARLTEGRYTYRGKSYEMNSHGVVRRAQMQVVAKTSTSISLSLKDNEETRSRYPFAFELIISYALDGHTVAQTYEVRNPDTKEKLIFTVGGHPGFNVPLTKGESFEDYYVQFDGDRQPQLVVMTDACFDTGRRTPYHLEEGSILPLKHSLFDIDGLFLTYIDKALTLKSRKSDRFVHMEFPDMNVIGFWHKPSTEAPFLCIEPWHGIPSYDGIVDDFETKQLMIHLAPGKVYTNTVRITVG